MEINGQKSSILKIVKMQKSDMKNLSSNLMGTKQGLKSCIVVICYATFGTQKGGHTMTSFFANSQFS